MTKISINTHCPEDQHQDHYLDQTQHDNITFNDYQDTCSDQFKYQQTDYGEYDSGGDNFEYEEQD